MRLTPLRISAVSFLNTTPLIWGLVHGPLQSQAQVRFELPSACADSLASGAADIGIVPVIEMQRQALPYVPGLGIASEGPVRSIFVVSRVPAEKIRTLAMDTSSRSSVELARIILARKYANRPRTIPHGPAIQEMLRAADAALVIGDPALRLSPQQDGYYTYDLGREWTGMTDLPMVYAVWAGLRSGEAAPLLQQSYDYGRARIDQIVEHESAARGFPPELTRDYLTRHIVYELSERHRRGLELFLQLAAEL